MFLVHEPLRGLDRSVHHFFVLSKTFWLIDARAVTGSGFAPAALTTAAGNNVVFRGDSNPTDFAEITMATPMARALIGVEQVLGYVATVIVSPADRYGVRGRGWSDPD